MECIYDILSHAAENYPDRLAYRQPEGREHESTVSFSKLKEKVDALRASLLYTDVSERHIAIVGETSIEWITVYLSIVSGVGVCVPIDRGLREETIVTQLKESRSEILFLLSEELEKDSTAYGQLPRYSSCCFDAYGLRSTRRECRYFGRYIE